MQTSNSFISVNDLDRWSENYFKNPTPERMPAALAFCARTGLLNEVNLDQHRLEDPSCVFRLSQIFRRHPDQVWDWVKACRDFSEKPLRGLIQVLWLSQLDKGKEALAKFANSPWNAADFAAELLARPVIVSDTSVPARMQLLWSTYFVAGDFRAIGLLIDSIPELNRKGGEQRSKVMPICMSLIRNARVDETLSVFIVQHCRAHAASGTDRDLQHLIAELAPRQRQNYSVDQLFPLHPHLKAEVKNQATTITNIVFGVRQNPTQQQAQDFAQEQYRNLTARFTTEQVKQMLFMLNAQGIDDSGLSTIASFYGLCVKKQKNGPFTDYRLEPLPTN